MFYQNMIYMGYFELWVIYFLIYSLYLKNIVQDGKQISKRNVLNTYLIRYYGLGIMNMIMAISLVFIPLITMLVGVHVYWIAIGTLYTLIIHFYFSKLILWGEVYLLKLKDDVEEVYFDKFKGKEIEDSNNYRVLNYIMIVVILIYLLVVAFNAFDIIPLQSVFFPPIMPLYYHILLDFIKILGLFLLSAIMLLIVKKRLDSIKSNITKEFR